MKSILLSILFVLGGFSFSCSDRSTVAIRFENDGLRIDDRRFRTDSAFKDLSDCIRHIESQGFTVTRVYNYGNPQVLMIQRK